MGPARRNKARRPPSEPEQKAGTPVRTQGRTAEGFHRRRRQAQPVPSPGLRLPELFQTERFIGVYHTPIFIKMQSFFSEIAWNSTQKLPAVRLHRQTKGARAPPGARAAHASIQFASEPRSAAAAAVISTAAAVPAATGIPTAPAVPTAAAEDDDQHDDPQAASAAPAVIAAPHIEVPPEDEDLRRRCAALKLSYVRGGKGLQIEAAEFHQNGCHLGPAGWIRRPESPLTRRNDQPRRHCPGDCVPGPAGHLEA